MENNTDKEKTAIFNPKIIINIPTKICIADFTVNESDSTEPNAPTSPPSMYRQLLYQYYII